MTPTPGSIAGQPFVCSWSGGKDSCLSFYRAVQAGGKPASLLTMLHEDGRRSRSHALDLSIIKAQAAALGLPLIARAATWDGYEEAFIDALKECRASGITAAVFGDIDVEDHLLWEQKVCAAAGLEPFLPIWQESRLALLDEFLGAGFKATIVAANKEKLDDSILGQSISAELIPELEQHGVDPCGEYGEFHTVVTGGPIFSQPLVLKPGKRYLESGYWFLEMSAA